jgi:hypothetical protein
MKAAWRGGIVASRRLEVQITCKVPIDSLVAAYLLL